MNRFRPNAMAHLLPGLLAMIFLAGCQKPHSLVAGSVNESRIAVRPYALSTKGVVTNTTALESKGRFVLEAYVDDDYCDYEADPAGEHPYPSGKYINREASGNVTYGGGKWSIQPAANWVANVNTTFWCWAPTVMTSIPDGMGADPTTFSVHDYAAPYNSNELIFEYARPGVATFPLLKGDGTLSDDSPKFLDADIQDDIILSYARQEYTKEADNDMVDLVFYHPLSQIRFAVSPDDGTYDTSLRIVQIAIKNIKQGGVCTFHGTAPEIEDKFVWDLNASPLTSYCQTFDAGFKTVPDGWTAGSYKEGDNTYRLYTAQNVFFVTPQDLASLSPDATLVILFEDRGTYIEVEEPLEKDVWKPGYYYTYKIAATVLGRTIKVGVSLADWQNYDDKLFI